MNKEQAEILKSMMLKTWMADAGIPLAIVDADARASYAKAEALVLEMMEPMMKALFGDASGMQDVHIDAKTATEMTLAAWLGSELMLTMNGWLGNKVDEAIAMAHLGSLAPGATR